MDLEAAAKTPARASLSHEGQVDRFLGPFQRLSSVGFGRQQRKQIGEGISHFCVATWLDWLVILLVGATAAGVWKAPHSFTRLFPVTAPNGTIYWPELAYPYLEPIFSSVLAGALAALIPIAAFAIAQVWQQSFVDFASAGLGLAYSMVAGTCFQVILKKTIGGLRPHFLDVCQPIFPPPDGSTGAGYLNSMYTAAQLCTGDTTRIENALESFPSGHAEVVFAGLGYLAIYLFAHLRIEGWERRVSFWRMVLVMAPLLFATYVSSTLVLGYHHHSYDVLAGALIGMVMALLGYRMVFEGVFDHQHNTVPYLRLH